MLIGEYVCKFAAVANYAVTDEMMAAFNEALEDFDERTLRKGLKTALKECKRFPFPADICEICEAEI